MYETVLSYIQQQSLLSPRAKVIVGFSGGADSVALLYVLHRLEYDCVAAHCNFHLRGEESMRDEEFARNFAQKHQIPFEKKDFDTRKFAISQKISIEMAARELRYNWFEELRLEHRAEAIAVGHHKDDSVETVLLNLTRGTGIKGLAGIRPKSGHVIRPLLVLSKEELLNFLHGHALQYVTDSTNLQDTYVRNKIRLQIMPLLKEINPAATEAIERTTHNLLRVEEVYNAAVERGKKETLHFEGEHTYINIGKLLKFPAPDALLYEILSPYRFNNKVIQDVNLNLSSQPGKVFYSDTHRLVKDREHLILSPLPQNDPEEISISEEVNTLQEPVCLEISKQANTPGFRMKSDRNTAYFDNDKLQFPLILRKWKEKDFFVPFGMKGKQKISKYFKDHKFSRVQKESAWLLCSGENIIWIVGERTDNRFRIDENTRNIYSINLL